MKKITKDPKTGRVRVQTVNDKPSKTQQQYKDQVDINLIMKKYLQTGILPINKRPGIYADLTSIKDYQTSLNAIMKAKEVFGELPADIRLRFDNDPKKLLDFIADPKTIDEQIKLGLREKPAGWVDNDAIKRDKTDPPA